MIPIVIQSFATVAVALVTGIFGVLVARVEKDKSAKPSLILPKNLSVALRQPKKFWISVIAFTVLGGGIGYLVGGNIQRTLLVEATYSQFKEVSELTTIVFSSIIIVSEEQQRSWLEDLLLLQEELVVYKVWGEVRAGFDLTQITTNDFEVIGNKIILHLPPPKILTISVDPDRSYLIDTATNSTVEVSPETFQILNQKAKDMLLQNACDFDILNEANQSAENSLLDLINPLIFGEIDIVTQVSVSCP